MSKAAKRKQKSRKGQSVEKKDEERVKDAQKKSEIRALESSVTQSRDNMAYITPNIKFAKWKPKRGPQKKYTPEEVKENKRARDHEFVMTPESKKTRNKQKQIERETYPFREIIYDIQKRELDMWEEYMNSQHAAIGDTQAMRNVEKKHKKRFKRTQKLGKQRIDKLLKLIEERTPITEVLSYGCNELFFNITMLTPKNYDGKYAESMPKLIDLLKSFQMPEPRDTKKHYVFHAMISNFRREYLAQHAAKFTNVRAHDPRSIYHDLRDKYESESERLLGIIKTVNPAEDVLNFSKRVIVFVIYAVTSHMLAPKPQYWEAARRVAAVAFNESEKHLFVEECNDEKPDECSTATTDNADDFSSIQSRDTTTTNVTTLNSSETSSDTVIEEQPIDEQDVEKEWLKDCSFTYKSDREALDNEMQYYLLDLYAKQAEEIEQKEIRKFLDQDPDINSLSDIQKETLANECIANGNIFFRKKHYKRAIICSTKALEYCQKYIPALLLRAKARLALDWFKPAMADVEAVLEMEEDNVEAQRLESRAHLKFADALECEALHDCDMGTKETNFTLGPLYEDVTYASLVAELKFEASQKQIKIEEQVSRDSVKLEIPDGEHSIKQEFNYPLRQENSVSFHDNMKVKFEPTNLPKDEARDTTGTNS